MLSSSYIAPGDLDLKVIPSTSVVFSESLQPSTLLGWGQDGQVAGALLFQFLLFPVSKDAVFALGEKRPVS